MKTRMNLKKLQTVALYAAYATALLGAKVAYAQTGGEMPWNDPLETILKALNGDTAKFVVSLAIVGAGLAFCFGEAGSFFRKVAAVVFGGAVAVKVGAITSALFGWTAAGVSQ